MPPPHTVTVTTNTNMEQWGSHAQGSELHCDIFHGLLDLEERLLHINDLELQAAWPVLANLNQTLLSQVIQIVTTL